MLAPDDTAKYESSLRRTNSISMYNYEKTTIPGNKSKRNYLIDERKEQIERENRALIKSMRQYDKSPIALYKSVNHMRYSHSLVLEARRKEIQKVEEENRRIFQRIIKTAATMNTRIFVKEYYKNHQFQYNGGHFKMPPLTNRPKTACLAFQTNGINSEIPIPRPKSIYMTSLYYYLASYSEPLDPIMRKAEIEKLKQNNQLVLNKSYDIIIFHGMQIISDKTVMITLWELYKLTDKGRDGTNGIKIESKTNNRESGIILSINELIYICSSHPILRKLMKELLLLEEPETYSSLYKVLGLPNDNTYAVELINYLCKFIIVEDDRNILELSERLKEMIEKCHNNEDPEEYNEDDDDMFVEDYEDTDNNNKNSLSLISNDSQPPLKSIKDDNNNDDDILAKQIEMGQRTPSTLSSNRYSTSKRYSDVKSRITTRRNDKFESDNSLDRSERRKRVVTINYKNSPNYTKELTAKKFVHSPNNSPNVKPIKKTKSVGPPHCATVTKPNTTNTNNNTKSQSPKHSKKVSKNVGPPRCATVPLKKNIQPLPPPKDDKMKKKIIKKKEQQQKKKKVKVKIDKEVESADILVLNRDENSDTDDSEIDVNDLHNNIYQLQSDSNEVDVEDESSLINEMGMKIVNEIEHTVRMTQEEETEEEEESENS